MNLKIQQARATKSKSQMKTKNKKNNKGRKPRKKKKKRSLGSSYVDKREENNEILI